ncbi:hypothetical protein MGA3_11880 [Bacillus methanolicus MGA3]|nr:hypothetical protein MGA3_11880 [Bacillus methanolicus MGA3]
MFKSFEFIWSILLTPSEPFSDGDWIIEWKTDGIQLELIPKKIKEFSVLPDIGQIALGRFLN